MGVIEYILLHHRWIFVCFFLLPISAIYDVLYYIRNKIIFTLNSAPKNHRLKVKKIQEQVRKWNEGGRKTKMCTSRPGWSTMSFRRGKYKSSLQNIDINLMDIIEVDVGNRRVKVQPQVTMGQLTATLLPMGWTIPIVPELDDLTIGGLIMGCGVETSSHKAGLFQHTCLAFELVTADGSVQTCTKEMNPDLFAGIPWSHGTLGFLVSAEIRLIPAKKYVKVHYEPLFDMDDIISKFSSYTYDKEYDFVEGLVYRQGEAIVMSGKMTDECVPEKINAIGNYDKPWFYKYTEKFFITGPTTEYIPLRDYYHRHSRSIFWQIKNIIPFGNAWLFRKLFGWMVPPKVSLLKLTQTEEIKKLYEENQMIQDMLVPLDRLEDSLKCFHKLVNIYPLWLCPFTLPPKPGFVHSSTDQNEMYVDIGAYGEPNVSNYHPKNTTRALEAFVRQVSGFQMLYADTYMTKEEFRKMFDHSLYDKLREKYNCIDAFPEVYDKISKAART